MGRINGRTRDGVFRFVYLRVMIDKNGGCRKEVENCVVQRRKVGGVISIRKKSSSLNAVRRL